jgi:hypothetical protein
MAKGKKGHMRAKKAVWGAAQVAGAAMMLDAVARLPLNDGVTSNISIILQTKDVNQVIANETYFLGQLASLNTADPYVGNAVNEFLAGLALVVGGKIVKKLVPSIHRVHIKVGKYRIAPV